MKMYNLKHFFKENIERLLEQTKYFCQKFINAKQILTKLFVYSCISYFLLGKRKMASRMTSYTVNEKKLNQRKKTIKCFPFQKDYII